MVLLSDAALTVAFAVLVAAAAALDRRFRLPEVAWFVLLGIAALGWRLVAWPGPPRLPRHRPGRRILERGGPVLRLGPRRALGRGRAPPPGTRRHPRLGRERAPGLAGVFACVVAYRITAALTDGRDGVTHWSVGLFAVIWGTLALVQAHRARLGGPLAEARRLLAGGEAVVAGLFLASGAVALNPFLAGREAVEGPWPLDTLLLAYALSAAVLAFAARRVAWLPGRDLLAWAAGGLGALWAALALRRLWHRELVWTEGFTQPELYAYTVTLLAAGGVLLYRVAGAAQPGAEARRHGRHRLGHRQGVPGRCGRPDRAPAGVLVPGARPRARRARLAEPLGRRSGGAPCAEAGAPRSLSRQGQSGWLQRYVCLRQAA